jgi:hypothetical protein
LMCGISPTMNVWNYAKKTNVHNAFLLADLLIDRTIYHQDQANGFYNSTKLVGIDFNDRATSVCIDRRTATGLLTTFVFYLLLL